MQAVAELPKAETKQEPVMGIDERMEMLRQKEAFRHIKIVDGRDWFEAGWDAGKAYAEKGRANVQD